MAMIAEDLMETRDKACRFLALVIRLLSNAVAANSSADTGVVARTVLWLWFSALAIVAAAE